MNPIMPAPRAEQSGAAIMHEYLGIAQRSKWLILGCIAFCVVLAWSYCLIATKYYRSEALLVVDEPKLLESVVQKSVDDKFEQQLFLVQRQIMSLNFLGSIAKEFDLYPEAREEGDENAAVCSSGWWLPSLSGSRWILRPASTALKPLPCLSCIPIP